MSEKPLQIDPPFYVEPDPSVGNNITKYANKFIIKMPEIHAFIFSKMGGAIDYSEIDKYMSFNYDPTNPAKGIYAQNTGYSPEQKSFIYGAIQFFRVMREINGGPIPINGGPIPLDNPDIVKLIILIKELYKIITDYQAGTDNDDIARATTQDRLRIFFQISRYFNLDPTKDFFSREFDQTGLGKVFMNFDVDEKEELGQNRFYNILFGTYFHLIFAALVFPHWPIKIPVYPAADPPISVYIGTGGITDANYTNFKIADIMARGNIPPIRLYTPITSASNDASVAVRFLKEGGVIIKINLAPGKPYMCVSASQNEAETFVLASNYIFIRSFEVDLDYQNKRRVYEFNQSPDAFTGLTEAQIIDKWDDHKALIAAYTAPASALSGPQLSLPTTSWNLMNAGGSKSKRRRTRRTKRRSNKRTKTRKTKRRSNKRRRI